MASVNNNKTSMKPTIEDIDFSRRCIAVAFLRQLGGGDPFLSDDGGGSNAVDIEAAVSRSSRVAWHGSVGTIWHILHRLAVEAYSLTRHYSHCELCFYCSESGRARFGDNYMISCGTREGTGVRVVAREFNDNYMWLYVNVTHVEQQEIVRFMFDQNGKPYDSKASNLVFTSPRPTLGKRWYCSEIVLSALQLLPCPTLHEHRPNCVEVDDLFDLMRRSPRRNTASINIAPFQINKVWNTGGAINSAKVAAAVAEQRKASNGGGGGNRTCNSFQDVIFD